MELSLELLMSELEFLRERLASKHEPYDYHLRY